MSEHIGAHHQGATARDKANQHNGDYYSGPAFQGGTHYHYNGPSQDPSTGLTTQLASSFRIVQIAVEIANYFGSAEEAVASLLHTYTGDKSDAEQIKDLQDADAKLRRSSVDARGLEDDHKASRDSRDLAKAAASGLKAADGLAAMLNEICERNAKNTRQRPLSKVKPAGVLEKHAKQLQSAQKDILIKMHDIMSDHRRYAVATAIRNMKQSTEPAVFAPFENCLTRLSNAATFDRKLRCADVLVQVDKEGELLLHRRAILASLKYEEINYRRDKVESAHPSTYSWMFPPDIATCGHAPAHEPKVFYTDWLQSAESAIYWITGKAGSGKSTLMKYISENPRTHRHLRRWCGPDRRLYITSHFFWYQGSPLQKSCEGLLRSILYDVLRRRPDLIEPVCSAQWSTLSRPAGRTTHEWTSCELEQSIVRLADSAETHTDSGLCFCIFIDGLDEYAGDHQQVLKLLQDLARAKNVKLCVSSRPWEIFQQFFSNSVENDNALTLHHHTMDDIALVVSQTLHSYPADEPNRAAEMDKLLEEIVVKAQGVFLWVTLVLIREIVPGLRYADSISKLRQRMSRIPPGLHEYFEHIFNRIGDDYREETARLFLACQQADKPLPLPAFGVVVDDDPADVALSAPLDDNYTWNTPALVKSVRAQVNGRCQDLLAVEPSNQQPAHHIEFLHRSVKEFLEEPSINEDLRTRAGTEFDVNAALFAAYVLLAKMTRLSRHAPNRQAFEGLGLSWSRYAMFHVAKSISLPSNELLDHLDQTMTEIHGPYTQENSHWATKAYSEQKEDRYTDFLCLLISAGMVSAVRASLTRIPRVIERKKGRPYLDYALRHTCPDYRAPAGVKREPEEAQIWVDRRVATVKTLLGFGTPMDERVYRHLSVGFTHYEHDSQTIWDTYIAYLYNRKVDLCEGRSVLWALIEGGARDTGHCLNVGGADHSMSDMLHDIFDLQEANMMCDAIGKNEPLGGLTGVWSWLKRGVQREVQEYGRVRSLHLVRR